MSELEQFCRSILQRGFHCDLNPTRMLSTHADTFKVQCQESVWWHGYLSQAEHDLRMSAVRTLQKAGLWTEEDDKRYGRLINKP